MLPKGRRWPLSVVIILPGFPARPHVSIVCHPAHRPNVPEWPAFVQQVVSVTLHLPPGDPLPGLASESLIWENETQVHMSPCPCQLSQTLAVLGPLLSPQ